MINITDAASFDRALEGPLAPEIKRLLRQRRDQLLNDTGGEYDIGELAHFIVVEADPPDTIAGIQAAAGYPLIDEPAFEWVQYSGGWFEGAVVLSDEGFGLVLFCPDDDRIEPELIDPLRSLAASTGPTSTDSPKERAPAAR